MALKRLDEEFELKPGTQLLPYMKRLLPSLEGRFQTIEGQQDVVEQLTEEIRAAALLRMNEILIPATQDIIAVTKLGFLLGPSSTTNTLKLGPTYFVIDEGPQRNSFTPSPYLIIEREANITDYAIARMDGYNNQNGELLCTITAWHGNAGPWSDWMISSTPGMADSTKIYHDEVGPWRDEVAADTIEVRSLHSEVLAAAAALAASGLDVYAFIRRDGTVPFIAPQQGYAPVAGSNDLTIPTTAWTRQRIIEYTSNAVNKLGDVMSGPLTLNAAITQPNHAATKSYVDAILGQGGTMNANLTLLTNSATLTVQTTGTLQNRGVAGHGPSGRRKWALVLGDASPEAGNNLGSDFALGRYDDNGTLIDSALTISRATGAMVAKAITYNGSITGIGGINAVGDISIYRQNAPTTSAIYLNQAKTAYYSYAGGLHSLGGGGLDVAGAATIHGGLACVGQFSTNGYLSTTWGLTCHGEHTVNGNQWINGQLQVATTAPICVMYDTDWGPMYMHHQNENIGFLNHQGAWIQYTNYQGYIWSPAYGWIHDYVNNTASNQAWNAANYRYNQLVSTLRIAYLGDRQPWGLSLEEPWNGGVITGAGGNYSYYGIYRYRQMQCMIAGGWYVVGYA